MKKFITGILVSVILSTSIFTGTVFANDKNNQVTAKEATSSPIVFNEDDTYTYKISAIDLVLKVPKALNTLTRNVSNGNPALEKLDTQALTIKNNFIQNNIYLSTFPDDLSFEIVVSSTKINSSDVKDLSEFSDEQINEYMDKVKTEVNSKDSDTLTDIKVYKNDKYIYICYDLVSDYNNIKAYIRKYYTIVNGYNYTYTLQSDGKEINNDEDLLFTSIIDNASYEYVKASLTESSFFVEMVETLTGFFITVLVLGGILLLFIKSSKKK